MTMYGRGHNPSPDIPEGTYRRGHTLGPGLYMDVTRRPMKLERVNLANDHVVHFYRTEQGLWIVYVDSKKLDGEYETKKQARIAVNKHLGINEHPPEMP